LSTVEHDPLIAESLMHAYLYTISVNILYLIMLKNKNRLRYQDCRNCCAPTF